MATIGDFLTDKGLERLDSEILLGFVLKKERPFVLAHPERILNTNQERAFQKLVARRKNHEPIACITGFKEFYGRTFSVTRATLIPRPETELLIEKSIEQIKKLHHKEKIAVIDVGTGSGAIVITLAKELAQQKNIHWFATDISQSALRIAQKNARRWKVAPQIKFLRGNLLTPITKRLIPFNTIVVIANLPYLSKKLYISTTPTVKAFEPKRALLSGRDGLDHYRRLFTQLKRLTRSLKIHFLLEISPEQSSLLPNLLPAGYTLHQDLARRERIVSGTFLS